MLITPTWTSERKASRSGRVIASDIASLPVRCTRTIGPEGRLMHDASLLKLALAAAAALLLAWQGWLAAAGRPQAHRGLRDTALAALGIASLLGWWNFLQFHGPGFVHGHDLFNYYVGSKYFPELG